ncbi:Anaerobic ribonucleoside-triphosphate reductase [compost metagenome]
MDAVEEILAEVEKGETVVACSPSEKMLKIGATASKEFYLKRLLPEEMADAHLRGDLHIQDLEHYAKAPNSFVIPLSRLMTEGYRTPQGMVRAPKRAHSAASLAAIALQAAQSDCFGGQVFDRFDSALAGALPPETTDHELSQAMEGLVYNLNMLHSRNGGQVPYSTLTFGADPQPMARRIALALLDAYEAGLGRGEPAVYPNLVFLHQAGVNAKAGDPNFDLLQRALDVAGKRMQPTFAFLDAPFNQDDATSVTYLSGCARIGRDRFGHPTTAGRGAIATVTLNLVRAALRAKRDGLDFTALLERQARLAIRTLHHRFEVLSTLKAHELPFLMGEGLYAESGGLDAQEAIAQALRHGHLALGFIGLAEALKVLTGAHHGESEAAQERGLSIVSMLRKLTDEASETLDLNVVLYAQQADKSAGRFPMLDQWDFGPVAGVTDKGYYTSAFSLPAAHAMSAGRKIALEAPYHALCNGGHLTALTFPAPVSDADTLGALVARMADAGLGHGAFSFPVDHCAACGHSGVIPADCPACLAASGTIRRVRRVAGYLEALDRVDPGKRAELEALAAHCDGSL